MQTKGVDDANATGRPDVAVAVRVKGIMPMATPLKFPNVIAWGATIAWPDTTNIACVTEVPD